MILDAIASSASQISIFDTLSPSGPREVAKVFIGTPTQIPDGVKRHVVFGRKMFDMAGGENVMTALAEFSAQGDYRIPVPMKTVESGFKAINPGLEELKNGVSLTKLLVTV